MSSGEVDHAWIWPALRRSDHDGDATEDQWSDPEIRDSQCKRATREEHVAEGERAEFTKDQAAGDDRKGLSGGDGDDRIEDFDGSNNISGGGGSDWIDVTGSGNGGSGDNLIFGDAGNDTIIGGFGSDTIFGGEEFMGGVSRYIYNSENNFPAYIDIDAGAGYAFRAYLSYYF